MRSFVSVLSKASCAAMMLAVFLPSQAMAQDSCNAEVSVAPEDVNAEFFMGEPIPIVVTIGAGSVVDIALPNNVGYLDIFEFEYKLDCNAGETFTSCTDAGNTVDFDETSLWTNCTDTNDAPVIFALDEANDTDKVVIFTPTPTAIRNDSDVTCEVGFDVQIDAVAPGNDQRVVEMTGWVNAGGDGNLGVCSNGLPADATADIAFDFNVATTFHVTKDFSDDNTGPVDVNIRCNAGLPLEQSFTISETSDVTFTVKHFQPGDLDCHVWEEPVSNYVATYAASAVTGTGITSSDADGCYFDEVEGGGFLCAITNDAGPGTYTVNKEWILGESGDEGLQLIAPVTIFCDSEILADDAQSGNDVWYVMRELTGQTDSVTISVDTNGGTAQCETIEGTMPDYVMVDNGCRALMDVVSGEESSCDITNTMFFEGIPTLNQYGLVLLVLLTFGIGMVGFRRYA